MKKVVSLVLVTVMLVGMVFALASCGGVSGSYTNGVTTYTFSGSNYTKSLDGRTMEEGKYSINGSEITFTCELDGREVETEWYFEKGEDEDGKFIMMGISKTLSKKYYKD